MQYYAAHSQIGAPDMADTLLLPSLKRRLACLLYEQLLLAALLLASSALFLPLKTILGPTTWLILFRLFLLCVLFAYFGLSWVKGGQTVAMKAWRLRLVTADAQPISWGHAIFRYGVALALIVGVPIVAGLGMGVSGVHMARLSLLWSLLTFLWAWFDPQGQTLHDRLCGTRLILLSRTTLPRP